MARKYVLTVETKISPSLTLRRARDAALSKIRETTSGTFHCDLSRDMSDGARFSRMDNDATAVRMGDAQVRSPALEGKPIDLNNDFSGTESKPETVPGLKALALSVGRGRGCQVWSGGQGNASRCAPALREWDRPT